MPERPMRGLDRLVRLLLRAAPADVRRAHGDEIRKAIGDAVRARRRAGRPSMLAAGLLELADLSRAVIGAHLRTAMLPSKPAGAVGARARTREHTFALAALWRDARLAVRSLAASPAHTVIVAGTLALGIGINAAVFSVLDSILVRPLPFADASRLVTLWRYNVERKFSYSGFTPELVAEWRTQTDLFDAVEGAARASFVLDGPGGAEMIPGAIVTPGLLPALGVPPADGRLFNDADGRNGTHLRAIVSERFLRSHPGSAPSAVGRRISLDGQTYEIVGVMPASFRYPNEPAVIWTPYHVEAPPPPAVIPSPTGFDPLARLVPGMGREQAAAAVMTRGAAITAASRGDAAGMTARSPSARLMPIAEVYSDRTRQSLVVLGGAVAFLLLIVCANVASLALARALSRARDFAVRAALGASRAALIRETLVENLLLAGAGAVAGVGIARLAIAAAVAMLPESMTASSLNPIDLDARALLLLIASALLTSLLFGLPPALVASRVSVRDALSRGSRASSSSSGARRMRAALVIGEVALAIVLLTGAGLMTRSLINLYAIDVGFEPEGLVAMQIALPAPRYAEPSTRDLFTGDLLARLERMPGVVSASAGEVPPDHTKAHIGKFEFSDRPGVRTDSVFVIVRQVWPGYFRTAGITLVGGRPFSDEDSGDTAIISDDFARAHFPGGSAVGARFRVGDNPWRTIVGVASRVRPIAEEAIDRPVVYYPPGSPVAGVVSIVRPSSTIAEYRTIVVRADSPASVVPRLPSIVHAVDSGVVVWKTAMVEHLFAQSIARPRVVFLMMAVFAGFGLLIAAAGIYGVLSHLVAARLREIGIRLAVGARPHAMFRLILTRGLALTAAGVLVGLGLALGLARAMSAILVDVGAVDPVSLGAAAAVLALAAVLAAWLPARRAMLVDPISLLREQ